jgi:preprotein translocase subunit SecF
MERRPSSVIDLVGRRKWFYLFSFLVLLPGTISLLIPPSLKIGIDFTSGSTFTVSFEQPVSKDELKSELSNIGHAEARIQSIGPNKFLVRTKELRGATTTPPVGPAPSSEEDTVVQGLRTRFGNMTDAQGVASPTQGFLEFSSISASLSGSFNVPKTFTSGFRHFPPGACCGIVGDSLTALFYASFAIFLFLWYSFRLVPQSFRFGAAAILALLHDVLFVVGVFSILGKTSNIEINSYFITAILTVIGFSVHDSIVVFDRIRETVGRGEGRNFTEMVNNSLLQTLGRSLNTSLTLIFAILALLLMGGSSIRDFLIAMLAGTVTGVYSSVFIASQILVSWDEGDIPRIFRRLTGRPASAPREREPLGAEA